MGSPATRRRKGHPARTGRGVTGRTHAHVDPEEVAQLARDGMGRNAVARHLGVSRRAVDEAARIAGVSWVRTSTEAATKARMADRRAELAEDFSQIADGAAERLLDALDRDELDANVLRALANVAGLSVDKLTALADRLDADEDRGDSLLDQLRRGIDSWHAGLTDQDQTNTITDDVGDAA